MQYAGRLSGMENERNVRNNRFAADRSGTLGKSQLRAGGKKVGTMTTDTDISNGGGDLHSLAGAARGPDLTNPSYRTGTYQLLLQRPFDGGSPQQFLVRRRRPVITQVSSLSSDPDRSDLRTRFLDATIPSVLPTIRTTRATTVTRVIIQTDLATSRATTSPTTEYEYNYSEDASTPKAKVSFNCERRILISRAELFKPENSALFTPANGLCLQIIEYLQPHPLCW